jgi:hypothetical protein
MIQVLEEYARHAALNFGQALQGVRYFYSHPDIDRGAARGTAKHLIRSMSLRAKRVVGDVFFAVMPPHGHHSRDELRGMTSIAMSRWFQYGYCAWRFDETGAPQSDLSEIDRRWDPRCLPPPV